MSDTEVVIPHDVVNEQVVLAAAVADWDGEAGKLLDRLQPDTFLHENHRAAWAALQEMRRRKLQYDPATLKQYLVDPGYLQKLVAIRPDAPANLGHHLDGLLWDRKRANAVQGPIAALLEAVRNPSEEPERVRALARHVAEAFQGEAGRGRFLADGNEVVRSQMDEVRRRIAGHATYTYGIKGLDYDLETKERRVLPGPAPGQVTVFTAISGGGKALALDTPIATASGWTTMGEIEVGDAVWDERGEPCNVLAAYPVMWNRRCFRVTFSDGASIVADEEHLWKTESYRERYTKARRVEGYREKINEKRREKLGYVNHHPLTTATLLAAKRQWNLPEGGSVRTTAQIAASVMVGTCHNHSIVVAAPLVANTRTLPIHPYVLGVWLGDGTAAAGTIASNDYEVIDNLFAEGYEVKKLKAKFMWGVKGLHTTLREQGLLGNKHIPQEYLRASTPQRLALLQGLMDTDGYASKDGKCNFDTTSPALRDGMGELLATLGIKGHPNRKDAKLNGRIIGDAWRFVFITDLPVFRLTRKLVRVLPTQRGLHKRRFITAVEEVTSVPVRCIRVDSPSHLYLAGREMIPTHNTTAAGRATLGIAKQRRKVLYGAYEMGPGMTLELLACMSLGWSRSKLLKGHTQNPEARGEKMSTLETVQLEERMHAIHPWVSFMRNPFRQRGGQKASNQRNLDTIQEHIVDSGCQVFVADLWKRCLVDTRPEAEEDALYQQQAMAEETRTHHILLQQQRLKDIEARPDKRPTREGIKGSGAWTEIADTILGFHLPGMWKNIANDKMEIFVLKQRHGEWPIGAEFDWSGEYGSITGGVSVEYKHTVEGGQGLFDEGFKVPKLGGASDSRKRK